MASIGEALVRGLEDRGVRVVFGIPEFIPSSCIEAWPGPGSAISRPGTNRVPGSWPTAMPGSPAGKGWPSSSPGRGSRTSSRRWAQARADSVPMLVISGVNDRATLGHGLGKLHELPDQQGLADKVAGLSARIASGADLGRALDGAYAGFANGRPGPAHVEIPTDVMGLPCEPMESAGGWSEASAPSPAATDVVRAAELLAGANQPANPGGRRRAPG